MKDTFNIYRFWALAKKDYRENMRFNLIFIAVVLVVILLAVTKFNPFQIEYSHTPTDYEQLRFIRYHKMLYVRVFWGLLFGVTGIFAARSFRGIMSSPKALIHLMLPVSSLERYLLAFLNSFVVVFVVYLLLFYGVTSVTNSYKYVGLKNMSYVEGGWFGNQLPHMEPGQKVVHAELGNVFKIFSDGDLKFRYPTPVGEEKTESILESWRLYEWNMLLICWLTILSMNMWGAITFRKSPFFLNLLIHGLIILVLGVLGGVFIQYYLKSVNNLIPYALDEGSYRLIFWGTPNRYVLSYNWLFLVWLFPIGYQGIIWWKLKTKQVA